MADFPTNSPVTGAATAPTAPQAGSASQPAPPQPIQIDPQKKVGEISRKFTNWRNMKRQIEVGWYINEAYTRGVTDIRWNDTLGVLEERKALQNKKGKNINKILPKVRQRKGQYLKNKYAVSVLPATSEREDKLDATATEKGIQYVIRKRGLRKVYRQILGDTLTKSKSFIGLFWDPSLQVMMADPFTGQAVGVQNGDIVFEGVSPFEILVPDMGVQYLSKQEEFIRARAIPVEKVKTLFKDCPDVAKLVGDSSSDDLYQYQRQIATLANRSNMGIVGGGGNGLSTDKDLKFVIVKEHFQRPTTDFPQGQYTVVAKDLLLKYQPYLPYGFSDMDNPYPVVEFPDIELAGQFWPTCIVDQLIGPQQEYNDYRRKLRDHLDKQVHPKIIVSVFAKWPQNAWNSEAGEVIQIVTPPGMMEPKVIQPPSIAGDLWRALDILRQEIDELSVSTAALGEQGSTTSGFQVNLLNEQMAAVNVPDIEAHELAFQDLYMKIRRMMKLGYQQPLLINAIGRNHVQDVFELKNDQIDENAEVIVQSNGVLSDSPAVRTQQVMELWTNKLITDPNKALSLLGGEGVGEFQEESRRHEEKARNENMNIGQGKHVPPPLPMDNHSIHLEQHTDEIVSPEFEIWDQNKQREIFAHWIMHCRFVNPSQALQVAMELGLTELLPMLQPPPGSPASQPPTQNGGPQSPPPPPPPQQGAPPVNGQ